MEGEIIIVALISTFGMIISIMLWNHNWFKRLDAKYKYQLKRTKLSQKLKAPIKEEKSGFDTFRDILPLLKNLDSEQLGALADKFLEGDLEPTSGGGIGDLIIDYAESHPEAVKSFLEGLSGGKKEKSESGETGFPTQ